MKYSAINYRSAWVRAAKASVLAAFALLAACSSIPRQQRDAEQLERYLRYAGPPVEHITYLGHYDGWNSIGRYQLVLWTNFNDAYLITVRSPCEDLQFADHIGVTHTLNTIDARFDSVVVKHWKCQISEIRPVDYRRMQQDLRKEHEQEKARAPYSSSKDGTFESTSAAIFAASAAAEG